MKGIYTKSCKIAHICHNNVKKVPSGSFPVLSYFRPHHDGAWTCSVLNCAIQRRGQALHHLRGTAASAPAGRATAKHMHSQNFAASSPCSRKLNEYLECQRGRRYVEQFLHACFLKGGEENKKVHSTLTSLCVRRRAGCRAQHYITYLTREGVTFSPVGFNRYFLSI